jgi:hypothetical protein
MKLIAVPHQFYGGEGEPLIHFNEDTLALTELDPIHRELLGHFAEARTVDEVLATHGGDEEIAEVIDELVELELVAAQMPAPPVAVFKLRPNVRAFRIVLTEKCNLRCAECFVVKHADKLRVTTPKMISAFLARRRFHGAAGGGVSGEDVVMIGSEEGGGVSSNVEESVSGVWGSGIGLFLVLRASSVYLLLSLVANKGKSVL